MADTLLHIHPLILSSPETVKPHPNFLEQQYRNIELQKDEIDPGYDMQTKNETKIVNAEFKKIIVEKSHPTQSCHFDNEMTK